MTQKPEENPPPIFISPIRLQALILQALEDISASLKALVSKKEKPGRTSQEERIGELLIGLEETLDRLEKLNEAIKSFMVLEEFVKSGR